MSKPVTCRTCGETWPRDPAREVPCPMCKAKVGQQCRRPSGHRCSVHEQRDRLAVKEVDGYGRCRKGHQEPEPEPEPESDTTQSTLFGSGGEQ